MAALKINYRILILFLTVIAISWTCSLDKLDPTVKYDPCLGKVTSKFTHDKIGVACDSPCTVKFTNLSIGAKTYRWDFGEGGSSTEPNPTYIFKKAGKWDVKLTANSDNNCSTVSIESVTINTPIANLPIADFSFTFSNNNQFATTTVNFKSNSQNAASHKWTFDDNNETSPDASTSHTYKIAKGYNVTLEVTNNAGLKASKTLPVTVNAKKFALPLGGSGFDNGRSVQQTRDGGYITCGYTTEGQGGRDVYMIKTDSAGRVLSKKTFGGQLEERGFAIQQTTLGGYVMTGFTNDGLSGSSDVYLIITDVTGTAAINNNNNKFGGNKNDEGNDVKQTQDGGFIICGYTESMGLGKSDVYLVKTDANGVLQWQRAYGKTNNDSGNSIQQTSDLGYIICGQTDVGTIAVPNYNVFLIKTKANGDTLWTKTFGGLGSESGSEVQITKDEGYIICGTTDSKGKGSRDMYLIKTDKNGNFMWEETYGGVGLDNATSVQQTSDGGYAICGSTYSFGSGGNDVYFVITDDRGKLLKEKTYGGVNFEEGFSVKRTTDGGYIICGYTYSFGAGQNDFYLIKTDKDGNEQ